MARRFQTGQYESKFRLKGTPTTKTKRSFRQPIRKRQAAYSRQPIREPYRPPPPPSPPKRPIPGYGRPPPPQIPPPPTIPISPVGGPPPVPPPTTHFQAGQQQAATEGLGPPQLQLPSPLGPEAPPTWTDRVPYTFREQYQVPPPPAAIDPGLVGVSPQRFPLTRVPYITSPKQILDLPYPYNTPVFTPDPGLMGSYGEFPYPFLEDPVFGEIIGEYPKPEWMEMVMSEIGVRGMSHGLGWRTDPETEEESPVTYEEAEDYVAMEWLKKKAEAEGLVWDEMGYQERWLYRNQAWEEDPEAPKTQEQVLSLFYDYVAYPTTEPARGGGGYYDGGGYGYGGYGGYEEEPEVTVTWQEFQSGAEGAPGWWQAMKPSELTEESELLASMNMIIPYMSPDDQVTLGMWLYQIDPVAFAHLANLQPDDPRAPTDLDLQELMSSGRMANAIIALQNLAGTMGKTGEEMGTGFRFLMNLLQTKQSYTGAEGEYQSRAQALALQKMMDQMASGATKELAPYKSAAQFLSRPSFVGGQLRPMQRTAAGGYAFGEPIGSLM